VFVEVAISARISPDESELLPQGPLDTLLSLAHGCFSARGSAVMDLRGWLLSLGLQQYEAAFRENEIDETLLPSLTAQDLKDIGIVVVGHRRKLLNAIAALTGETSTAPFDRESVNDASLPDTAERRQVTVMFADLVGSTELSTRMDPEDLREVISAYRKCVAETVRRLGGFGSQYLGDGVLIFLAIRRLTKTTPSGRCGQGCSSSPRSRP